MSEEIKGVTKTMLARLNDIGQPLTFATIKTSVKNEDEEKPAFKKETELREFLDSMGFKKPPYVRLMICNVEAGKGWWVKTRSLNPDDDTMVIEFSDDFLEEEQIPSDSNLGRKIEKGQQFTVKFNQIWSVR